MFPNFPNLAQAIAAERAADFQRDAAQYRRAHYLSAHHLSAHRLSAERRPAGAAGGVDSAAAADQPRACRHGQPGVVCHIACDLAP